MIGSFERLRALISTAHTAAFRRYVVVGFAQNAFFYSVGLLLLALGWAAWQTVAVTYPIATVVSFIANRSWTFGASKARGQFLKYILLYGGTYPASVGLTWLLEHEGIPRWLATLITMGVVLLVFFIALRNWVFVTPSAPRETHASV